MPRFNKEEFLDFLIDYGKVKPKRGADERTSIEEEWSSNASDILGVLNLSQMLCEYTYNFLDDSGIKPHSIVGSNGIAEKFAWALQRHYWDLSGRKADMKLASFREFEKRGKYNFNCRPEGSTLYVEVFPTNPPELRRNIDAIINEKGCELIGCLMVIEPFMVSPLGETPLEEIDSAGYYAEAMVTKKELINRARERILEGTHPFYTKRPQPIETIMVGAGINTAY